MHHGFDLPADLRKQAEELGLGPTGAFPEGRLTPEDEGEIKMGVTHKGGSVVLSFGKAVSWVGMGPQQARELAEAIRRHSHKAEGR